MFDSERVVSMIVIIVGMIATMVSVSLFFDACQLSLVSFCTGAGVYLSELLDPHPVHDDSVCCHVLVITDVHLASLRVLAQPCLQQVNIYVFLHQALSVCSKSRVNEKPYLTSKACDDSVFHHR